MAAPKKAKKEAKAFDEYSIAELKDIVKQHAKLEAQLAAKDAQLATKQNQLVAKREALQEAKSNAKDHIEEANNDKIARQADQIQQMVHKQFLLQMIPEKELSEAEVERLRGPGRPITVMMANVSQDMMSVLGLDKVDDQGEIKTKFTDTFFSNGRPTKNLPGKSDFMLQVWRPMNFKYKKSQQQLQVDCGYKMVAKPKPKPKPKVEKVVAAEGQETEEGEQQAVVTAKGDGADADSVMPDKAVAEVPSPARVSTSDASPAEQEAASPSPSRKRPAPEEPGASNDEDVPDLD